MSYKQTISTDNLGSNKLRLRLVAEAEDKAVLTYYPCNHHNIARKHYEKDALQQLSSEVENVQFPTPENYTFKFIDLFAGIGDFRLTLQNVDGKCIHASQQFGY